MKVRDLTPACIGRQVRVEQDPPVEGKLIRIAAEKDAHGYLDIFVAIGGWAVMLDGDEPVTITG